MGEFRAAAAKESYDRHNPYDWQTASRRSSWREEDRTPPSDRGRRGQIIALADLDQRVVSQRAAVDGPAGE